MIKKIEITISELNGKERSQKDREPPLALNLSHLAKARDFEAVFTRRMSAGGIFS